MIQEIAQVLANDAAIVSYGGLDAEALGLAAPYLVDHQFVIRVS